MTLRTSTVGLLDRAVRTTMQNFHKNGARRRLNWSPKMLNNRLYKGYGSGTMMHKNEETGRWEINPNKVRMFVPPSADVENNFPLRAYVAETPEESAKRPDIPITRWDFIEQMEKLYILDPEKCAAMVNRNVELIKKGELAKKPGKLAKWGY